MPTAVVRECAFHLARRPISSKVATVPRCTNAARHKAQQHIAGTASKVADGDVGVVGGGIYYRAENAPIRRAPARAHRRARNGGKVGAISGASRRGSRRFGRTRLGRGSGCGRACFFRGRHRCRSLRRSRSFFGFVASHRGKEHRDQGQDQDFAHHILLRNIRARRKRAEL
jgi:hypothetical protein